MLPRESLGRILDSGAAEIGIPLSPAQQRLLERYVALIVKWNQRLRLTGMHTPTEVAHILVLGALEVLPFLPEAGSVLDLGSGAGVPGIPVAVMRPGARVVLAEAARRKAAFLELAVRNLGLANVSVLNMRAEALGRVPEHREQYEVVTARAVAPLRVLAEYALPLVRIGGVGVFPKGAGAADEVAAAAHVLGLLGGRAETRPSSSRREWTTVLVWKVSPTPLEYPRRPGVPSRRPL